MQSRFHGGFGDLEIVSYLSRRPGLVVRAANHSAVLGRQLCQRVADQLPVCHEIQHAGGTPIPFAAPVISTTLPMSTVTPLRERYGSSFLSGTKLCQHLEVAQLSRAYRGASPHQRVEQRRARLVDAGVDIFGTIGYRAATIDHICARAGLSKRYFYESFPDSEALLLACYERCVNEFHDAMVIAVTEAPETIEAQLRAALFGYFSAIDADQRGARITLLEVLGVSTTVDEAYAAQFRRFASSVETLAGDAFSTSRLPKSQLDVIAQGIFGAITSVATQWYLDHRRRPRAQLIDATYVLVLAVLDQLPHAR